MDTSVTYCLTPISSAACLRRERDRAPTWPNLYPPLPCLGKTRGIAHQGLRLWWERNMGKG